MSDHIADDLMSSGYFDDNEQEGYIQQIDGVVVVKISDDYKVDKEFAPLIDLRELFQLIMDDINDS